MLASETRLDRHRGTISAVVALGVILALAVLSLLVGARDISISDVLAALFSDDQSDDAIVVKSQRVPRTVLGLLVGLALGIAGALMQAHTRNALADPGLFGVNAGAAFGVVVVAFWLHLTTPVVIVTAAIIGAFAATAALLGIASLRRGATTPVTLALAGAAIGAMLGAATTALILMDRQTLDIMRFWTVGSLAGRELGTFWLVLPIIVIGVVLAAINSTSLDALALGDAVAISLGSRVRMARLVGVLAITLLAAASTAACGPIGFVGLVVPHVARLIVGADNRRIVLLSALLGAILVLVSDVIGRVILPTGELQVGLVLAALGGPVLVLLLRRRKLAEL